EVSYVVTRNIQYTNVCYFRCGFCAFSKGRLAANLRGAPYLVPLEEIVRRSREAWERGATEVCLQGGIHPAFTGDYYADVVAAIGGAVPGLHVHAFSALEVWQGAATLGLDLEPYLARLRALGLGSLPGTAAEILDDEVRAVICPDKVTTDEWLEVHEGARRLGEPLRDYLLRLKAAGLASLPGTAAEILDDEVRAVICPDKVTTEEWLEVHRVAHSVGLRSNITIMFGHVESPRHWARHLLRTRDLQAETGGFTEFVPLPFVHMAAPMYRKRQSRPGPTFREAVLIHAVARIAYRGLIDNIQVSWVKMGAEGVRQALLAGVNDLGGTLMDENISRAAGAAHGQLMEEAEFRSIVEPLGRRLEQRTTLYGRTRTEAAPVPG
ncbi:MAG TPA: radical SAM protein, partial [Actinomycetota bacterium]|nr:radical SAM protein [Actinomycetota bacterium]